MGLPCPAAALAAAACLPPAGPRTLPWKCWVGEGMSGHTFALQRVREPRTGDEALHLMSVAGGQKDDGAESSGEGAAAAAWESCSERHLWAESASVTFHKPDLVWPNGLVWAHFDR